jgi:hypothetical protein
MYFPLLLTVAAGSLAISDKPKDKVPAVKESALRRELLAMVKEDQKARMAFIEWSRKNRTSQVDPKQSKDPKRAKKVADQARALQEVDRKNRVRLKRILAKHGWPGKSLVGKDGANAAWLLAQHADEDRPFQKRCLAMMKAAPQGEVTPVEIAYLTDRVLVGEKKKQLYGTQCHLEKGKYVPLPLEDPANVDKRRAALGLPPLDEYLKQIEKLYGGKK